MDPLLAGWLPRVVVYLSPCCLRCSSHRWWLWAKRDRDEGQLTGSVSGGAAPACLINRQSHHHSHLESFQIVLAAPLPFSGNKRQIYSASVLVVSASYSTAIHSFPADYKPLRDANLK